MEQIQDKVRSKKLSYVIPNAPIDPCHPPLSRTQVYELHLQGSPTSHVVGACATHLPGTKRYVYAGRLLLQVILSHLDNLLFTHRQTLVHGVHARGRGRSAAGVCHQKVKSGHRGVQQLRLCWPSSRQPFKKCQLQQQKNDCAASSSPTASSSASPSNLVLLLVLF